MNVHEFRSRGTYLFVITIQSTPFCRWRCGRKFNETGSFTVADIVCDEAQDTPAAGTQFSMHSESITAQFYTQI